MVGRDEEFVINRELRRVFITLEADIIPSNAFQNIFRHAMRKILLARRILPKEDMNSSHPAPLMKCKMRKNGSSLLWKVMGHI
ncbi:hypothetical protein PR048_004950 [Dryococelus australis]|uniref:Uncharacterized protein n=1 Tax=Dryococelus australis TaxID=614101 RepID=A0ABQ9I6W5_9NEOP|nr:hypothetical protein PR048_004950 [Dryococelus australis]